MAVLAGGVVACDLEVTNENNPDRPRVLARPVDVEGLGSSLFQQIISGTLGSITRVQTGMLTASFENSSSLANNGLGPRSTLPRGQIDNGRGNPYETEHFNDFRIHSQVARSAADVLNRANGAGFSLGSAGADQRLKAIAWFNHGVALGNLSMVYDSAAVPQYTDAPADIPALAGYAQVNAAALASFDSALTYANMTGTSALPAGWITGGTGAVTVDMTRFRQIINSYKARVRAGVARTPAERAAVNWGAVIAEAAAGITSDFTIAMDPVNGWDFNWLAGTLHYRDSNWHQMTYYIIGMADTTGAYAAWLNTDRGTRTPFLIRTPDRRFASGETRAAQQADRGGQGAPTGGKYFRTRDPGLDQAGTGWGNSWYDHYRWRQFSDNQRIGAFPIMTKTEIDMLRAEGLIRTGNIAGAAALIDLTRVPNGLPALTGAVTTATQPVPGGSRCVPMVPTSPTGTATLQCGNIMEAMKWEKRLEIAYTTYGGWFFDSRGWGDLPEGTAISWPVPYQELDARLKPIYNLGGVGNAGGAAVSTYGFGSGTR
jgi:hypothetical protein